MAKPIRDPLTANCSTPTQRASATMCLPRPCRLFRLSRLLLQQEPPSGVQSCTWPESTSSAQRARSAPATQGSGFDASSARSLISPCWRPALLLRLEWRGQVSGTRLKRTRQKLLDWPGLRAACGIPYCAGPPAWREPAGAQSRCQSEPAGQSVNRHAVHVRPSIVVARDRSPGAAAVVAGVYWCAPHSRPSSCSPA